jgi:hypothetical protein
LRPRGSASSCSGNSDTNKEGYFWADDAKGTNVVHRGATLKGRTVSMRRDNKGNYYVKDFSKKASPAVTPITGSRSRPTDSLFPSAVYTLYYAPWT